MDFREFQTGPNDTGRRLDKVLRIFFPELTLPLIYKNLRKGLIKINGSKSKPDYRINQDDIIQVADFLVSDKSTTQNSDSNQKLSPELIVFENEHILILNKPCGINVHSAKKDEISLQNLVTQYYKETRQDNSLSFRPGPLHRIDKFTQGLVCFSMSTAGAQWFSRNMKEHKIKKTYSAVVQGKIDKEELWKDKIEKLEVTGTKFHTMTINDSDFSDNAKECITKIVPLESFKIKNDDVTKVIFEIETGRQHQIRAQSAYHGFPLYGDIAYGGKKTDEFNGSFYLAAQKIEFPKNELGIPEKIELK